MRLLNCSMLVGIAPEFHAAPLPSTEGLNGYGESFSSLSNNGPGLFGINSSKGRLRVGVLDGGELVDITPYRRSLMHMHDGGVVYRVNIDSTPWTRAP
jgi:hypothetical protein